MAEKFLSMIYGEIIVMLDFIKLKISALQKTLVREWDKPKTGRKCMNGLAHKRPLWKICNEFLKLNSKKTNHSILKWIKDLDKYISKECVYMEYMQMQRYLTYVPLRNYTLKE